MLKYIIDTIYYGIVGDLVAGIFGVSVQDMTKREKIYFLLGIILGLFVSGLDNGL